MGVFLGEIPSGNLLHSYRKLSIEIDVLLVKNGVP
jgi:hypothetical protein